jgi:ferredoxin
MRVWIDQDLCTGDGLCTDHCPDVFVLLEDGISYVRHPAGNAGNDPGGRESIVTVPDRLVDQAIAAAVDCPGECIFLEADEFHESSDADIVDAEFIDRAVAEGSHLRSLEVVA